MKYPNPSGISRDQTQLRTVTQLHLSEDRHRQSFPKLNVLGGDVGCMLMFQGFCQELKAKAQVTDKLQFGLSHRQEARALVTNIQSISKSPIVYEFRQTTSCLGGSPASCATTEGAAPLTNSTGSPSSRLCFAASQK